MHYLSIRTPYSCPTITMGLANTTPGMNKSG